MTHKQIRELFKIISPAPGFIAGLSRKELEELVEDETPYELAENGSNAKRLEGLLRLYPKEEFESLINILINKAGEANDS